MKVVSFDIFGTLVDRVVDKPSDVFRYINVQYFQKTGIKIEDFYKLRILSEQELRNATDKEITLQEIYDNIQVLTGEQKNEFIHLEEEAEINLSYPIDKNIKILKECVHQNIRTILISDMYLPRTIIESILERCGINGYDKLYISCESGYKKSNGSLYDYVLKESNIDKKEWLHIGDNLKSDFIIPKQKGIRSRLVSCPKRPEKDKFSISDEILLNLTKCECGNPLERFGFQIFGPLTFGYVSWLNKEFRKNKINKIFFFSREGYFIKEAFDLLYGGAYETKYLYVSRKSLVLPNLIPDSLLDDLLLFRPMENKNAINWLKGTGVIEQDAIALLNQIGVKGEEESNKLLPFMDLIKEKISEANNDKFKILVCYLKQENVEGKFAVVDIGWTGSMQIALDRTLQIANVDHNMFGYFIGQRPEMEKFKDYPIKNKGYLFSYNSDSEEQKTAISGNALFELFYMAPHGTTLNYCIENGEVVPNLAENEYASSYSEIRNIQEGVLHFLKEILGRDLAGLSVSKNAAYLNMKNFLLAPDYKSVDMFGDISFLDGDIEYLAKRSTPFKIKDFVHDFKNAYWKVGFLKRNIKLPLPYYSAYWKLRDRLYKEGR